MYNWVYSTHLLFLITKMFRFLRKCFIFTKVFLNFFFRNFFRFFFATRSRSIPSIYHNSSDEPFKVGKWQRYQALLTRFLERAAICSIMAPPHRSSPLKFFFQLCCKTHCNSGRPRSKQFIKQGTLRFRRLQCLSVKNNAGFHRRGSIPYQKIMNLNTL